MDVADTRQRIVAVPKTVQVKALHTIPVILPTLGQPTHAELQYVHAYTRGRQYFDYLHLIRQMLFYAGHAGYTPDSYEESYYSELDRRRHAFAAEVQGDFDLLIDAPSSRGYHRPFVSAVKARFLHLPWVRLTKSGAVFSNIVNPEPLRSGVNIEGSTHSLLGRQPAPRYRHALIVDDVFSTGLTAAVCLEKLRVGGLSDSTRVTVACPLYVKPEAADDPVHPHDIPQDQAEADRAT